MGYLVDYTFKDLIIPAKNIAECLKAINALYKDGEPIGEASGGGWSNGKQASKWYGFTQNPPCSGYPSLEAALKAWRISSEYSSGDLIVCKFKGEKLSDEEIMFQILAKFARATTQMVIRAEGEDGERWGFKFQNKQLIRVNARVVWE